MSKGERLDIIQGDRTISLEDGLTGLRQKAEAEMFAAKTPERLLDGVRQYTYDTALRTHAVGKCERTH